MIQLSEMPEGSRQTAHVLLDAVSTYEESASETWPDLATLSLDRLNEVDAVEVTVDEESEAIDIDISNLIGGSLTTLNFLIEYAMRASGQNRHEIVVAAREFLDGVASPEQSSESD